MHWCARRFGNTVVIDWHGRSAGHSSYFYSDGIHLTPRGARAYAHLIGRAVAAR
jgi:hypothetical protein